MKRPWQIWLALALCGGALAAAMGWLNVHALRVDRERSQARAEAELEQRISLALWRMDTKLAPMIAEEVARPHQFYNSFITLDVPSGKEGQVFEQVPSPLLLKPEQSKVILNFDANSVGQWRSPQAPPPELQAFACANGLPLEEIETNRSRLANLASQVDVGALLKQLPEQPLPQWNLSLAYGRSAGGQEATQIDAAQSANSFYANDSPIDALEPQGGTPNPSQQQQRIVASQQQKGDTANSQTTKQLANATNDFGARNIRFQDATQQEFNKQRGGNYIIQNSADPPSQSVVESVSRPLWIGDQLLLARRVVRDGETVVQGSWLDWPRIKEELLAETADLLPTADLAAVRPEAEPDPTRTLAGLPVKLVVGDAALAGLAGVDAPLQWALGVGWLALVLALAAVAVLLWGVLALSERRAAFVSSVTHELRTPLTTFRMYAEMLARDMVPSPERRREYLATLRTEAERLTHLVENVLAYARLERGRHPRRTDRTTPQALVDRVCPRLAERAAGAGMELECGIVDGFARASLVTDVGVVEQILFNLVDNAAKYAGRSTDRRIHLDVAGDRRFAAFTVRDHGPGFASPREAACSAPFSKSAQDAAETAPGVGLGLALCRRLARELGGGLDIVAASSESGAAVTLRLPLGG